MDNRVKSIEHEVGIYPSPGDEEESEPVDSTVGIYPLPGDPSSGEQSVHCSLPGNHHGGNDTYVFIYNGEADVNAIAYELVEDNIQLATVVPEEHTIIFTISRTTYYKVCQKAI